MGISQSNKIEALEQRIADLNGDGIVTRQEMETYFSTQLKLREEELDKLRKENKSLEQSHSELLSRYEKLLKQVRKGKLPDISQESRISNTAIEDQIKQWLADPNINIKYIPDRAEMFMYKKSLTAFLAGLEKVFESLELDLLGHRIKVSMIPIEN